MQRHDFDTVSFVFGLVFVTIAAMLVIPGIPFSWIGLAPARYLWPALILVAGVVILISAVRRSSRTPVAAPEETPEETETTVDETV